MKIIFYQNTGETLSINLLFNIIRQSLPKTLETIIIKFTYKGSSIINRLYDVVSVAFIQKKGDINHVTGDFNYAAFFLKKNKTILTIHDLYRLYVYNDKPLKKIIIKWFWLRIPISKAVIVTTVSETTRQEILKYVHCSPDKIRVIYNCISPLFIPVAKTFNKEKPVLLQMGTRPNKNLPRVIEAIAGICCKLDIVGAVSEETIRLLNHYKIDYSSKGNLTNQQVIQKYIECDMLIFVSLFEGFGMPIIEANTVERAVITADCSAMPEVAGEAACFVDPFSVASIRNGILHVIHDDTYRQNLIEAGKKNKDRFLARNIASKYYDLYGEVLGKSNKK